MSDNAFTDRDKTRLAVWLAREADDTREARLANEYVTQLQADYQALADENARLRGMVRHLRAQNDTLREGRA